MRLTTLSAALAMLMLASGCVSTRATGCDGFRVIRPAAADVDRMSGQLARQILAHNEFGAKNCKWKP